MRFITDGMLGKLTRWLRLAGEDVVYVNDQEVSSRDEDDFLLEKAEMNNRILITSDVELHRRALKEGLESLLIEGEAEVQEQMVKISDSLGEIFEIELGNSRCTACNGVLSEIDKESVEGNISDTVLEKNDRFWKCESCGKIYWPGSHWEKIAESIEGYDRLRGDFSADY